MTINNKYNKILPGTATWQRVKKNIVLTTHKSVCVGGLSTDNKFKKKKDFFEGLSM